MNISVGVDSPTLNEVRPHRARADRPQAVRRPQVRRFGFVYLIGHARAVKIGWSEKHPLTPGGRLGDLQVGSCDALELLGLIEAPFARERQIQGRFSAHRLRGEWFLRHQEILSYFTENGIGNEAR